MKDLRYSLVVQAANEDGLFGAHCPAFDSLGACTATGTSVEDAVSNAVRAIDEYLSLLRDAGVTPPAPDPVPDVHIVPAGLEADAYRSASRRARALSLPT